VVFAASGAPWIEAWYEHGRPVGRHVRYFEQGGVSAVTLYRGGKEEGISRTWWANGQLRNEIEVVRGVWSGRSSSYYENGSAESRGRYAACPPEATTRACEHVGTARHGRWRTWHPNGIQSSQGHWLFGERVGEWLYWTPSGVPSSSNVHQNSAEADIDAQPPAKPSPLSPPGNAPAAGTRGLPLRDRN
jgi:antitoxin component YwqK of YwqJK toxin-antitoxin module